MPASRSRSPSKDTRPAPSRQRPYAAFVLIGLAGVLAVLIAALPASLLTRLLPPGVEAGDLSGNFWHGAAGKLKVNGRDAGAVEWQLHPRWLALDADLHWVKGSFALDAAARLDRGGIGAHDIRGGGPIDELRDLSLAPGWHGTAAVAIDKLTADRARLVALGGEIRIADLGGPQIAGGADLGSYVLRFADTAVAADGSVTGSLSDSGGPLQVQGTLQLTPQNRSGLLSATLSERAGAPAEVHRELDMLAQMRGRDPQGRIPLDLEFTF